MLHPPTTKPENQLPYRQRVQLILNEIDRRNGIPVNRCGFVQLRDRNIRSRTINRMLREGIVKRTRFGTHNCNWTRIVRA